MPKSFFLSISISITWLKWTACTTMYQPRPPSKVSSRICFFSPHVAQERGCVRRPSRRNVASRAAIPHRMKSLGVRGGFGQSAYVAEDLHQHHGLTAEKMTEAVFGHVSRMAE